MYFDGKRTVLARACGSGATPILIKSDLVSITTQKSFHVPPVLQRDPSDSLVA